MMIKIVTLIAEDESINLPIQPLVWAVAFGPCFGGKIRTKIIDPSIETRLLFAFIFHRQWNFIWRIRKYFMCWHCRAAWLQNFILKILQVNDNAISL